MTSRTTPERTALSNGSSDPHLITVAEAAEVARRSVRTIRRAYLSGRLVAHRDGNGRGVRIRYGDLLAWLTAEVIKPDNPAADLRPVPRIDAPTAASTGNLELFLAARRPDAQRPRRLRGTPR